MPLPVKKEEYPGLRDFMHPQLGKNRKEKNHIPVAKVEIKEILRNHKQVVMEAEQCAVF